MYLPSRSLQAFRNFVSSMSPKITLTVLPASCQLEIPGGDEYGSVPAKGVFKLKLSEQHRIVTRSAEGLTEFSLGLNSILVLSVSKLGKD